MRADPSPGACRMIPTGTHRWGLGSGWALGPEGQRVPVILRARRPDGSWGDLEYCKRPGCSATRAKSGPPTPLSCGVTPLVSDSGGFSSSPRGDRAKQGSGSGDGDGPWDGMPRRRSR